ncbi:hypothetical protein OG373_28575 [Streptomyces avidinii]|uniref:hypothetical protein n=1 Tax=Streptomyces avidinii TaxID=1895 RepID=UPI003862DF11|nr:hypothetical protein OG373_28575 [Streptomyces avidinii]
MSSVEEFRTGARGWQRAHLAGGFTALEGRGGPGREHGAPTEPARTDGALAEPPSAEPLIRDRLVRARTGPETTLIAERILGLPKEVRA